MSRLRDLLLLVRAPLAATAVADVVTGYVLGTARQLRQASPDKTALSDPFSSQLPQVGVPLEPAVLRALALGAGASVALYWAGMALNDVFDVERDRTLAPNRVLPSGKLSVRTAALIGAGLLALGLGLAGLAGGVPGLAHAGGVAVAVLLYDALLKRARLTGALGMALCRGVNVLLGASIASVQGLGPEGSISGLSRAHAAAIASYVFALTLLSTYEDEDAGPLALLAGFGGALASVIAYGAVLPVPLSWLALAPLAALVAGRFGLARKQGTKATGKPTTRWLLRGLLLLDAGALLGVGKWKWALLVLALAVPYLGGAALLMGPPPKKS